LKKKKPTKGLQKKTTNKRIVAKRKIKQPTKGLQNWITGGVTGFF